MRSMNSPKTINPTNSCNTTNVLLDHMVVSNIHHHRSIISVKISVNNSTTHWQWNSSIKCVCLLLCTKKCSLETELNHLNNEAEKIQFRILSSQTKVYHCLVWSLYTIDSFSKTLQINQLADVCVCVFVRLTSKSSSSIQSSSGI